MPLPQVLVTGGTGFVGSRLTQELVRQGRRVKVLARPGSSRRALSGIDPAHLEIVEGDVTIGHTVYRALSGCDALFHVAAEFKIWDRRPAKILDAAIVGTRETLAAAKQRGIEKIVVTSSTAAVGATRDPVEMDETFAFNRENSAPYIIAKRRAEEVALEMADHGLPVVVVNPATILGPGDYKPTPSADLLLTFLRWNMPFGFPCTPGGFSVVDVDDVVAGHILAMDRGRAGQRYILGGTNATVENLFAIVAEITGLRGPGWQVPPGLVVLGGALSELYGRFSRRTPPLTYKFARDYIGSYVWVSSAKAEAELGFTHRPLRSTLARAIRFFLEHRMVPADRVAKLRFDLRAF
ncbi:MAG TPA: NAD-dependent epimerase/dehydratase family protein, partial [Polyangiaceae bacterium]|nr:NAD-dependent epimerase/dehydratase family protein [Polyangiaceae bacterium]